MTVDITEDNNIAYLVRKGQYGRTKQKQLQAVWLFLGTCLVQGRQNYVLTLVSSWVSRQSLSECFIIHMPSSCPQSGYSILRVSPRKMVLLSHERISKNISDSWSHESPKLKVTHVPIKSRTDGYWLFTYVDSLQPWTYTVDCTSRNFTNLQHRIWLEEAGHGGEHLRDFLPMNSRTSQPN